MFFCGPISSKNACFSCSEGVCFCLNSALSYALSALFGVENNKVPSTNLSVFKVSSPASAKTLPSLSSSIASSDGMVNPSWLSPSANMASAVAALPAMASAISLSLSSSSPGPLSPEARLSRSILAAFRCVKVCV